MENPTGTNGAPSRRRRLPATRTPPAGGGLAGPEKCTNALPDAVGPWCTVTLRPTSAASASTTMVGSCGSGRESAWWGAASQAT